MEKSVIISIHGIRTKGEWQDKLDGILSAEGFEHKAFKYGYYDILNFLNPYSNQKMIDKFYTFYSDSINNSKRPSIIAHSFGSYMVAHCLLKREDIKFDKIIFCGSILSKKFDWNTLLARNQINQIRNEFSEMDFWTKVVKYFVRHTGCSGNTGFLYSNPSMIQKRQKLFKHSDYFVGNHMKTYWVEFLKKHVPVFNVFHSNSDEKFIEDYLLGMRKIDQECYGAITSHQDVMIPEGLSTRWLAMNRDIYTYVVQEDTGDIKGYINAMPLRDSTFQKLIEGEIKDNEITEDDIVPYIQNQVVKIYIMSIATKTETRQYRGGLINTVAERLIAGLFKKLLDYWEEKNIKVSEFAAIAWTPQGKMICESIGMTSNNKDRYGHSIFTLNMSKYPISYKKYFIQGADNLIAAYTKG